MNDRSWCFETYNVTRVQTFLSTDGLRAFCVYDAPDTESVRQANRYAKVLTLRVWAGTKIA